MDLVGLAGAGVKQLFMTTPLVETERFKEGLARLDADLMAARAARGRRLHAFGKIPSERRRKPAWRNNCKRRSGSPWPASASPKAALNSREAWPCTKARRCAMKGAGSARRGPTRGGPSAQLRSGGGRGARAHVMRACIVMAAEITSGQYRRNLQR
jgi:hypothetical protein